MPHLYLPLIFAGADSIWFAMPITELVAAVFVAAMMKIIQGEGARPIR